MISFNPVPIIINEHKSLTPIKQLERKIYVNDETAITKIKTWNLNENEKILACGILNEEYCPMFLVNKEEEGLKGAESVQLYYIYDISKQNWADLCSKLHFKKTSAIKFGSRAEFLKMLLDHCPGFIMFRYPDLETIHRISNINIADYYHEDNKISIKIIRNSSNTSWHIYIPESYKRQSDSESSDIVEKRVKNVILFNNID